MEKRIERMFKQAKLLDSNPEFLAHWARYLCVLVSGYLEISIRTIYQQYARTNSNPKVAQFVEKRLKGFQNPKMEKIVQLAYSFSPEWGLSLENSVKDKTSDAINSVVANRNQIAHGVQVGITIGNLQDYYLEVQRVVSIIKAHCA